MNDIERAALPKFANGSETGAVFSNNKTYRYLLWRIWQTDLPLLGVVMLNPSIAGADDDDPTIRVVVGRAKRNGYGGILVTNLYGYIATSPKDLRKLRSRGGDPIGEPNLKYLVGMRDTCESIWCAWGNHAEPRRARQVTRILQARGKDLLHVGLTKSGQPKHPLRISYATLLLKWIVPDAPCL